MAGLLTPEETRGLLSLFAGGGSKGVGFRAGVNDMQLPNNQALSANVNGYYIPGDGMDYAGWDAEYKKRFGDQLNHELMLRYGQDQQQTPNYGIQYKYEW